MPFDGPGETARMNSKKKRRSSPHSKRKTAAYEPDVRDLEIYAEVCAGNTLKVVGEKHGISAQRAHQIMNLIDAWLAPQLMGKIREIKCNHTTRLMHIYHEAMGAWERSKKDGMEFIEATEGEGEKAKSTQTTKRRPQYGDPRLLAEARDALNEIREIWGANEPMKMELSGEFRVAGAEIEESRSELIKRLTMVQN